MTVEDMMNQDPLTHELSALSREVDDAWNAFADGREDDSRLSAVSEAHHEVEQRWLSVYCP